MTATTPTGPAQDDSPGAATSWGRRMVQLLTGRQPDQKQVPQRPSRPNQATTAAVLGLGRFGSSIAMTLTDLGYEVLGVDAHDDTVTRYADVLHDTAVADTTDEAALNQLGIPDMDVAVVAIGSNVEASVLTASLLMEAGMPIIWAKATSDAHRRILTQVGVHHVVRPERDMGERVAHLVSGQMLDYVELDDNFVMIEVEAPTHLVGKTLQQAEVRRLHNLTVVAVKPADGKFTYATADTVIGRDDLLVVAGEHDDANQFAQTT